MKKYTISFLFLMIFLTGCNKEESVQTADLDEIDTIYIQHGSNNLHLVSTELPSLEAVYDNKEVELAENDNEITLSVEKRQFHIGPKINLHKKFQVSIPADFSGQVIISGTSGNITSDNLNVNYLEINEKSGDVTLDFTDLSGDVNIKTISGDVNIKLNKEQLDLKLKTKTTSGKQFITIPIELEKQRSKVVKGQLGSGIYAINLNTTSGDITVQK